MKKTILLIFTLLVLSSFVYSAGEISYWNLSAYNDQWRSNDMTNFGTGNSLTYPTFNTTGTSSPNSTDCDGTSEYAIIPDDASLKPTDITVAVWINPDTWVSGKRILNQEGTTNGYSNWGLGYLSASASLEFNMFNTGPTKYAALIPITSVHTGTWSHIVGTYNSTSKVISIYLNGSLIDTDTLVGTRMSADSNGIQVCRFDAGFGDYWDGQIDEIQLFSRALTLTEIQNIYNYGNINGTTPTPPAANVTNFTITAINYWDSSKIYNITVNVTQRAIGGGSSTYVTSTYQGSPANTSCAIAQCNQTAGSITFPIFYNQTSNLCKDYLGNNIYCLVNISFGGTQHLASRVYNINFSSDYEAKLNQSEYRIFVNELFSNASITNFYVRINGTVRANTSGNNATINPIVATNYQAFVFDNAGGETYHTTSNLFNTTLLANDTLRFYVHPHELFVYAFDIEDGSTVNNFTINITSLNITDSRVNSTTTGVINFDVIHNTYNVTITDADGYAVSSPDGSFVSWQVIEINSSKQNFTVNFSLYKYNSVNFTWRDEDTNLKVPGTIINFTIINSDTATTVVVNSTNTSFYYATLLSPNNYEIQYFGEFYEDRSYFFTVSNKSTQQITLYVKNSSTTELYFVRIADETDRDVIGATVRLQRYFVNQSQFVTIEEGITNENGETDFYIEESSSIYYRFIILVNGTIVKTTSQQHILTLSGETKRITIYIDLGTSIFQAFDDINSIFYTFDLNRTDNISYFSFIDGNNEITKGCIIAKRRNIFDSAFTTLAGTCHVGTSGDLKLDVSTYISNNTVVRVEGLIYYTDLEVLLDSDEISTVVRGVNIDDNDNLIFTAIAFMIIAFAVLMIPNLIIQIIIDIGLLFGLSYFKFNLFPTSFIILLLILGIIINWNRRTTRDGNIQ